MGGTLDFSVMPQSQTRAFGPFTPLPSCAIVAVLLIAILLRFMDNFRFIDTILIMTGGGPANPTKNLPTYLFDVSFKFFELGRGAAIAFTLLLLTILLGLFLTKIFEDPARKIKPGGEG